MTLVVFGSALSSALSSGALVGGGGRSRWKQMIHSPSSNAASMGGVWLTMQQNHQLNQTRVWPIFKYDQTRSLRALRAPASSWRPFGPLDFVLHALRALRPCDPGVGDWIVC